MPTFQSKSFETTSISRILKRYPALFGVPFIVIVVGASFAMSSITQTRYDLYSLKVKEMSKEEELGLRQDRKKFDIREEYYRLQTAVDEEWESKRIPRPKGLPEWGVPPTEPDYPSDKNS